ncbi:hypothetical protein FACS189425_02300 [Clostridia bacterium]|nr:hypothetical protein FACS189425_02300 [Clostridia bacterium]
MQEQVNEKTVALSVKGAKLTGRLLAKAMQAFLRQARASPKPKHGKQSVKTLTKQGASLSNIEITGDNIGSFKRVARKYNVDFALQRDNSETPPKWFVFFKAKDADALTAAFKEYSKATLKVKAKPSFVAKLNKFKELAKSLAPPAKSRSRGEREH